MHPQAYHAIRLASNLRKWGFDACLGYARNNRVPTRLVILAVYLQQHGPLKKPIGPPPVAAEQTPRPAVFRGRQNRLRSQSLLDAKVPEEARPRSEATQAEPRGLLRLARAYLAWRRNEMIERGYRWAFAELAERPNAALDIEAYTYGSNDPFDIGAKMALKEYEEAIARQYPRVTYEGQLRPGGVTWIPE